MVLAYILITLREKNESGVSREVMEHPEVTSMHELYGEYDLIAKVKTPNLEKLKEFTSEKLSKIKGIDKITTMIVTDKTREDDNVVNNFKIQV